MKVIDLLNEIANSEPIPYRIKYNENIYYYDLDLEWYIREDLKNELFIDRHHLRDNIEIVNDVEIIDVETIEEEPKKQKEKDIYTIKKLVIDYYGLDDDYIIYEDGNKPQHYFVKNKETHLIVKKLNEIIDYLEENK